MIHTVSEDVEIVLNGQKYLLEAGDQIVLEDLDNKDREKLAGKFGKVESVDDYWQKIKEIGNFLRSKTNQAKKLPQNKQIEQKITDIYDFLDNYLDEFVMSLATPQVQDLINQDKINRSDASPEQQTMADIADTVSAHKRQNQQELAHAFGETPQQAVERMRKERTKEKRVFESVNWFFSHEVLT